MEVIPAINCLDSKCLQDKLEVIKNQLPFLDWLHIDISDGEFTPVKTWHNPQELNSKLKIQNLNLNIEVHLMVNNLEEYINDWLKVDPKRIIVHLEILKDTKNEKNLDEVNNSRLAKIFEWCSKKETELMFALKPETPVEEIFPYLDCLFFVQFLAVRPGFSGQKFDERILEKIKVLRERVPDIIIEVDGGINPETAKKVKEAGANIIVSASYIFNSKNPQKAYQDLVEIF